MCISPYQIPTVLTSHRGDQTIIELLYCFLDIAIATITTEVSHMTERDQLILIILDHPEICDQLIARLHTLKASQSLHQTKKEPTA